MAKVHDRLRDLVFDAFELEATIKEMEQGLEAMKANRKKLLTQEIPDLMAEVGTNVFGIPDSDYECRVIPYYHASVKEPDLPAAVKWLDDNGHGDLPKRTLSVEFNKEDKEVALRIFQRVQQMLAEENVIERTNISMKFAIHWKTLTAFVREQVERGAALPLATLGATIGQTAKFEKRR